jgi:NAD(P) transhydrogenase subunit alpha
MSWIQGILLIVFVVATVVGYILIKNVPSLLHTPLMSGMNALASVVVLGALATTGIALNSGNETVAAVFGCIAVTLAMINAIGGFDVTDRMLKMFDKKNRE